MNTPAWSWVTPKPAEHMSVQLSHLAGSRLRAERSETSLASILPHFVRSATCKHRGQLTCERSRIAMLRQWTGAVGNSPCRRVGRWDGAEAQRYGFGKRYTWALPATGECQDIRKADCIVGSVPEKRDCGRPLDFSLDDGTRIDYLKQPCLRTDTSNAVSDMHNMHNFYPL